MITRKNVIDQIIRLVYNGIPPDDVEITPNLVNVYLSEAISYLLGQFYMQTYKLDQIGYVPDSVYVYVNNIPLSQDTQTNYWYFQLPYMTLSLPSGRQLGYVNVYSGSGVRYPCYRCDTRELNLMMELPMDRNGIYYWIESQSGKSISVYVRLYTQYDLTNFKAAIQIPTGHSDNLNDILNIPEDMIVPVIDLVVKFLTGQRQMPEIAHNEKIEKPNA